MRIGLNAISFVPGKMGGMETYCRNLIKSLQIVDTDNSYILICNEPFCSEFPLSSSSFRKKSLKYSRNSFAFIRQGIMRNVLKFDPLKGKFSGLGLDVIHHPFTSMKPKGLSLPTVLTFHDMQEEFLPQLFPLWELWRRKLVYRSSAETATRIIAISHFTKQCLIDRYGISAEKIDVIYNGYGEEFQVLDDNEELDKIRAKYDLRKPFLLYPAATWPHKNHKNLLAALKILRDDQGFDGQLVLTGIAMKSHSDILAEAERLGLGEAVKVLGYLAYAELPYLYNLATMLVFPSCFEGFGIPLVEAMACGCPVVCSNATSLPEIVGEAGLLFDPASPRDMAEKVWMAWSDAGLRQEMRTRGLDRTELFDWENTARRTLDTYRKAVGVTR